MQSNMTREIEELKIFKERLTIAIKAARVCVFEVDLQNQLYTYFKNAEDIFGISGEEIMQDVEPFSRLSPDAYAEAVSDYFSHPDDRDVIAEAFSKILSGQSVTYEARMKARSSDFIWCRIDVTPVVKEGAPMKMIGVITDISELKRKNELIKQKARLDAFTGLNNKHHGIKVMRETLKPWNKKSHAFLLIDIDNFKSYNDTYGHYEGDNAIKEFADLMKESFSAGDILGRFGGDEFMVLMKNIDSKDRVIDQAKPLLQFQNNGTLITTSIGIAVFPQDASDFEELLKKADKALYHSKITKHTLSLFSELNDEL